MDPSLKSLFIACLTSVIAVYGSFSLLTEVLRTILPFGFLLVIALCAIIYYFSVPAPAAEAVEAIIGKDPHLNNDESYTLKTVAHRGAGLDAPENSLQAFQMCNEKGCDAIEFDVTLTKDEVPIVFHDDTLERLTDLNLKISEHNWADLSGVDISVKHLYKDRFTKTHIPTLEQTVTQLLTSGQRMFIDIKDNNKKFVNIIHSLFERHPELYSKAVVTSFFPNIIYFIRRGDPKIVCSMAFRPYAFSHTSFSYPQGKGDKKADVWYKYYCLRLFDVLHYWALSRITYYLLGLSVILLHKDDITAKSILDWRQKGVRVMAWTVNTPVEKQYVARFLKITYLTDTLTGEDVTQSKPASNISLSETKIRRL